MDNYFISIYGTNISKINTEKKKKLIFLRTETVMIHLIVVHEMLIKTICEKK